MIQSMTGFACNNTSTRSVQIHWEIRSINHRYLDAHFHLPELWRELELELRPLLQQAFSRGKLDIYLHCESTQSEENVKLNSALLKTLAKTHEQLQQYFPNIAAINMFEVLKQPGVIISDSHLIEEIKKSLLSSFQQVLAELIKQREREGTSLTQFLQNKFSEILEKLKIILPRREQVIGEQREKFLARINGLSQPFDAARMEQELLIWAQKSDINEEIERLSTHVQEAQKILTKGGKSVGRQLEFLLQEINREANTLSSKSTDIILTNAAVDIKVYLEQIREQLQNIA